MIIKVVSENKGSDDVEGGSYPHHAILLDTVSLTKKKNLFDACEGDHWTEITISKSIVDLVVPHFWARTLSHQ